MTFYRHESIKQHIDNANDSDDNMMIISESLLALAKIKFNEMRSKCLRKG